MLDHRRVERRQAGISDLLQLLLALGQLTLDVLLQIGQQVVGVGGIAGVFHELGRCLIAGVELFQQAFDRVETRLRIAQDRQRLRDLVRIAVQGTDPIQQLMPAVVRLRSVPLWNQSSSLP